MLPFGDECRSGGSRLLNKMKPSTINVIMVITGAPIRSVNCAISATVNTDYNLAGELSASRVRAQQPTLAAQTSPHALAGVTRPGVIVRAARATRRPELAPRQELAPARADPARPIRLTRGPNSGPSTPTSGPTRGSTRPDPARGPTRLDPARPGCGRPSTRDAF